MQWVGMVPFILCHVGAVAALWTGITWQVAIYCAALYVIRMFGVTGVYHRYFSHRTYKTSRAFQFFLAFLAQTSAQKGALWWAAHHRSHHRLSDQPGDLHSPVIDGFWYSHVGWLYNHTETTDYKQIPDFAKYPELRFLNRYGLMPAVVLGVASYLMLGWQGLCAGFFLSTVLLWHGTFTINSLSHVIGKKRFPTTDESRNNWLLAIITMGEGWHNNHHRFAGSTRQGFYWWEIDMTYYILKALSWVGLVWDLKPVPHQILAEGRQRDRARKNPAIVIEPATVKEAA
jgi:stearoyl-CoA desaturase (delta-9 desaturase)